jgi:hypothetical protein
MAIGTPSPIALPLPLPLPLHCHCIAIPRPGPDSLHPFSAMPTDSTALSLSRFYTGMSFPWTGMTHRGSYPIPKKVLPWPQPCTSGMRSRRFRCWRRLGGKEHMRSIAKHANGLSVPWGVGWGGKCEVTCADPPISRPWTCECTPGTGIGVGGLAGCTPHSVRSVFSATSGLAIGFWAT